MKYHCRDELTNRSLCGLVHAGPETWVFDLEGFLVHYNEEMRCKLCYTEYKRFINIARRVSHESGYNYEESSHPMGKND